MEPSQSARDLNLDLSSCFRDQSQIRLHTQDRGEPDHVIAIIFRELRVSAPELWLALDCERQLV